MILVRVHAAIGEQAEEMQSPLAGTRRRHRCQQCGVGEQFAILDHEIDLGDVHVDHAACANVEVADFAVAHLPGGQADKASAGMDQGVGKLGQQAIVVRLPRQRNRIGRGRRSITPAIEDDEDERTRWIHECLPFNQLQQTVELVLKERSL